MSTSELFSSEENRLIAVIQKGIPIVKQPFKFIADEAQLPEDQVIDILKCWKANGTAKRIGLVIQHRRLGINQNAMVVWNVPDSEVDRIGDSVRNDPRVTLCYRRKRHLPDWPYNLYCMIHGNDRNKVNGHIEDITNRYGLSKYTRSILFSSQQYKQRGGFYRELNN